MNVVQVRDADGNVSATFKASLVRSIRLDGCAVLVDFGGVPNRIQFLSREAAQAAVTESTAEWCRVVTESLA